ncbi:MAG: hypothetical protein B655_2407 [Methanobacterium sp. Maddingley MBC34]|nr:MAG: hypothetical protein B655_2407 [Methanobacterium sp. Maddingley MBC34]
MSAQKGEPEQRQQQPETISEPDNSENLEKLAKLLKDKGVITETAYNLIFG